MPKLMAIGEFGRTDCGIRIADCGLKDISLKLAKRFLNPNSEFRNRMLDGVLVIDKPAGLTSHDVVARVRRILSERRTGHTGTLDPFATGVRGARRGLHSF
jgi:hypothetical protein